WGGDKTVSNESPAANSVQNASANPDGASSAQAELSVETVSPSQDRIGNTLSADGTINAKDVANVSAKVNGVAIERILVEERDRVKAGQVLAIFDTDAMDQKVLQAEAVVAEADVTLANATADAARVLPLFEIV